MKVLVLFSVFFFVTISILLQHVSCISTLDKETYDLFVQLIKGEFTVRVKSIVGQFIKSLRTGRVLEEAREIIPKRRNTL